ncbi:MAG: hypothetical protein IGS39_06650 [Calothrix sp. C42_A2020_038]|nr:hypothetical protein [Calothrix sp. C42_A2020_038]
MFFNDLLVCLQMTTDKCTGRKAVSCYVNPPCGCRNPGKEIECENCEYLEACLSRAQARPKVVCERIDAK